MSNDTKQDVLVDVVDALDDAQAMYGECHQSASTASKRFGI
ncbi:hypothetical protein [Lacticaseibacillus saniviri]|nr:hypothetical protein [Lacticaseibacillus saniviri]